MGTGWVAGVAALLMVVAGCDGGGGTPGSGGRGGQSGSGGRAGGSGGRTTDGGADARGGADAGTGGATATGGSTSNGGSGTATGGTSATGGGGGSGGAAGASATGGAAPASGGRGGTTASGGASASGGRPATGGAVGTGGANTGGANTGGANTGGAATGGRGTGGANTGGANTGGANTGGANTGGANTGGANTGGANTGGAGTGGAGTGGISGSGGASVYIVAHPDDELLFANPHLDLDIGAGKRVMTVFLTSGATSNPPYTSREALVRAAHATMAGVANTWTCAPASFGGKMPILCTLDARPLVSMVFVRLDDGGSLANVLQNGQTATTLDGSTTYNAVQLRAVLTDILANVAPGRVGTLDATLAHGPEHADHIATGNVTFEVARDGTSRQLIMYRGYTMAPPTFMGPPPQPEAVNLSTAEINRKKTIMAVYNQGPVNDPDFSAWCERFYPVASVTGGAALIHAAGGGCLEAATSAEGAAVTVATTCAAGASQNWTATADGHVTGPGGRCLSLNGTAAVIRTCTGAADQTWTLMTNGQLRGRGTSCLARSGTAVSSATCTADTSAAQYRPPVSQRWNF